MGRLPASERPRSLSLGPGPFDSRRRAAKRSSVTRIIQAGTAHGVPCRTRSCEPPRRRLGGNLVAFARMDGAQLASIAIAEHKARAAARYRRPTMAFENGVQKFGLNYLMTLDDVIASRGGIPLVEGGKIIGAIGCSGGTGSQDEAPARPLRCQEITARTRSYRVSGRWREGGSNAALVASQNRL